MCRSKSYGDNNYVQLSGHIYLGVGERKHRIVPKVFCVLETKNEPCCYAHRCRLVRLTAYHENCRTYRQDWGQVKALGMLSLISGIPYPQTKEGDDVTSKHSNCSSEDVYDKVRSRRREMSQQRSRKRASVSDVEKGAEPVACSLIRVCLQGKQSHFQCPNPKDLSHAYFWQRKPTRDSFKNGSPQVRDGKA